MMDRRVKERLVGATILVALIVLVVPELLSGPKRASVPPLEQGLPTTRRNLIVDLATKKATPEPQAEASDGAPSADGRPASSSAPSATPGGSADGAGDAANAPDGAGTAEPPAIPSVPTIATLRAQESAPPPLETPALSPKSMPAPARPAPVLESPSRRGWAVQLGSFASRVNAEKLVHQLQASAVSSVYVVSSGSGSAVRFRVRVGPLADRGAAERAVLKLKAQGHAGTIVTPSS